MELPYSKHQKFSYTPLIGWGSDGLIIAISDDHIAKLPRKNKGLEGLTNEFLTCKFLYDRGVNVPKPEGIFKVKRRGLTNLFGLFGEDRVGFVMQWLKGHTLWDYDIFPTQSQIELFDQEVKKCQDLGFYAEDHHLYDSESVPLEMRDHCYRNGIYVPAEDKVYLIDFSRWKNH